MEKEIDEELLEGEEDESLCGNPSNHNNGETEGCAECAAIRLNI